MWILILPFVLGIQSLRIGIPKAPGMYPPEEMTNYVPTVVRNPYQMNSPEPPEEYKYYYEKDPPKPPPIELSDGSDFENLGTPTSFHRPSTSSWISPVPPNKNHQKYSYPDPLPPGYYGGSESQSYDPSTSSSSSSSKSNDDHHEYAYAGPVPPGNHGGPESRESNDPSTSSSSSSSQSDEDHHEYAFAGPVVAGNDPGSTLPRTNGGSGGEHNGSEQNNQGQRPGDPQSPARHNYNNNETPANTNSGRYNTNQGTGTQRPGTYNPSDPNNPDNDERFNYPNSIDRGQHGDGRSPGGSYPGHGIGDGGTDPGVPNESSSSGYPPVDTQWPNEKKAFAENTVVEPPSDGKGTDHLLPEQGKWQDNSGLSQNQGGLTRNKGESSQEFRDEAHSSLGHGGSSRGRGDSSRANGNSSNNGPHQTRDQLLPMNDQSNSEGTTNRFPENYDDNMGSSSARTDMDKSRPGGEFDLLQEILELEDLDYAEDLPNQENFDSSQSYLDTDIGPSSPNTESQTLDGKEKEDTLTNSSEKLFSNHPDIFNNVPHILGNDDRGDPNVNQTTQGPFSMFNIPDTLNSGRQTIDTSNGGHDIITTTTHKPYSKFNKHRVIDEGLEPIDAQLHHGGVFPELIASEPEEFFPDGGDTHTLRSSKETGVFPNDDTEYKDNEDNEKSVFPLEFENSDNLAGTESSLGQNSSSTTEQGSTSADASPTPIVKEIGFDGMPCCDCCGGKGHPASSKARESSRRGSSRSLESPDLTEPSRHGKTGFQGGAKDPDFDPFPTARHGPGGLLKGHEHDKKRTASPGSSPDYGPIPIITDNGGFTEDRVFSEVERPERFDHGSSSLPGNDVISPTDADFGDPIDPSFPDRTSGHGSSFGGSPDRYDTSTTGSGNYVNTVSGSAQPDSYVPGYVEPGGSLGPGLNGYAQSPYTPIGVSYPYNPLQQYHNSYPQSPGCGCAPPPTNCCPSVQPCCLPTIPCCPPPPRIPCCPQQSTCCSPPPAPCCLKLPEISCCTIQLKVPVIPLCFRGCPACPCRRRMHRTLRVKRSFGGSNCQSCSRNGQLMPGRVKRQIPGCRSCAGSNPVSELFKGHAGCGTCSQSHARVKRTGCLPCGGRKKREIETKHHNRVKRFGCIPCLGGRKKRSLGGNCQSCSNLGHVLRRFKRTIGCTACGGRKKRETNEEEQEKGKKNDEKEIRRSPLNCPCSRQRLNFQKQSTRTKRQSDISSCDKRCCDYSKCSKRRAFSRRSFLKQILL